jgi:cytochrome c553
MISALVALALCLYTGVNVAAEPIAIAKADPAMGKTVVDKICAACHGLDGNSPLPANPKLAGQIPEYLHKQLTNFRAAAGKKPERENPIMGAMAAPLSAEEMRNVVAYFSSQKPSAGVAKNMDTVPLGRKLYRGGDSAKGLPACAACHGANGGGIPSQYPRLAGQYAEYTELQLKAFREGQRANDANKMMRMVAAKMTDQEIRAISDYIAGLR